MSNYIDGFVLPIPKEHLLEYKKVAEQVADIWKAHGATSYSEFVGEDLFLEGTRSFVQALKATESEAIIFGWVVFESKAARDLANLRVPKDPRMRSILEPLLHPERKIFQAERMLYAGFQKLV